MTGAISLHPRAPALRKCVCSALPTLTMFKNRPLSAASLGCIFVATLLLGAVAAAPALVDNGIRRPADSCADGMVSRVYFGQTTPNGVVTDAQWRVFVAESVTPRFPAGFTELQAHGHWRDSRGTIVNEATRIVEIAHDGAPLARARVRSVAADYKTRFAQQSVLVTQFLSFQCF